MHPSLNQSLENEWYYWDEFRVIRICLLGHRRRLLSFENKTTQDLKIPGFCQYRAGVAEGCRIAPGNSTACSVFSGLCCCCLITQSCLTLCDPMDCSPQAPLSMGFPRQDYWNGVTISYSNLPDSSKIYMIFQDLLAWSFSSLEVSFTIFCILNVLTWSV